MARLRHLSSLFAMLLAAGGAVAGPHDGDWLSYRDAYRAMVAFEKYGHPKNLIQSSFQVMPKEEGGSTDGVHLTLNGRTVHLTLPLDATGRTVFPLLKLAYDENAVLVLNRHAGQFMFRPRVSLVIRPDGVYEVAELRGACEQALDFGRWTDASMRAKKCVGVRFVFAHKATEAVVRIRKGDGGAAVLALHEGAAFDDDPERGFMTATYRFGDSPERSQVVTQDAPLAIVPLID